MEFLFISSFHQYVPKYLNEQFWRGKFIAYRVTLDRQNQFVRSEAISYYLSCFPVVAMNWIILQHK